MMMIIIITMMMMMMMTITDHVKLAVGVSERGHGEGDDAAGGQRQVGVDDSPVLGVFHGQGTVEAGPEQPQEDGPCHGGEVELVGAYIVFNAQPTT